MRTRGLVSDASDASALADVGVSRLEVDDALDQPTVVLVVGVGPDGTTEARCLRRARG
jgi:hypothetical protein